MRAHDGGVDHHVFVVAIACQQLETKPPPMNHSTTDLGTPNTLAASHQGTAFPIRFCSVLVAKAA
jgi:hypothetical protein